MNVIRFLVFFFAAALSVPVAYSQATPSPAPGYKPTVFPEKAPKADKSRLRDLKGMVKDETNNPVEGAIIKLKNGKTVRTYHEGFLQTLKIGTFYFGGNRNFLLWSDR